MTVVAVTKTFPASDVALLAELGVRDVGENRDQEAAAKAAACREAGVSGLRWHFVGQLQTNKAASVAGYADVVHSIDRVRLVTRARQGRGAATAAGSTAWCRSTSTRGTRSGRARRRRRGGAAPCAERSAPR